MAEFGATLLELIELVTSSVDESARCEGVGVWTALDRLRAAVFVDQMSRNWLAVGEVPARVRETADTVALRLACDVDAECYAPSTCNPSSEGSGRSVDKDGSGACDDGAVLGVDHPDIASATTTANTTATVTTPLCCSVSEFCFFTLVFRHSSDAAVVERSIELLEGALAGAQWLPLSRLSMQRAPTPSRSRACVCVRARALCPDSLTQPQLLFSSSARDSCGLSRDCIARAGPRAVLAISRRVAR